MAEITMPLSSGWIETLAAGGAYNRQPDDDEGSYPRERCQTAQDDCDIHFNLLGLIKIERFILKSSAIRRARVAVTGASGFLATFPWEDRWIRVCWAEHALPVIVHEMADDADDLALMVEMLEPVEGVAAVEVSGKSPGTPRSRSLSRSAASEGVCSRCRAGGMMALAPAALRAGRPRAGRLRLAVRDRKSVV